MFNSNCLSPADAIALSGNNDGFGGNGSWIWLIVLIALFGGWGGNGFGFGGGSGATTNYVLNSDFATIQRQLSDGFNSIDNALDRQNTGICDLGYTQAQLINGVQVNQMQNANAIQTQLADCCCTQRAEIKDTQYAIATTGANIQNQIQNCCCENKAQIADLKYTLATESCATRQAIADGTKAIIDKMTSDRIAQLEQENNSLRLASSQSMQNQYLINALRPTPVPAFPANQLYGYYGFGGTTIA